MSKQLDEILQVQDAPVWDSSVERVEFHTINPSNPSALQNNDIIHFAMNQSDTLVLLESSYFLVSGRLAKKDADGALSASTKTKFVKGGILFLFSRAEIKIDNARIQEITEPGYVCLPRIKATYNDWAVRHLQLMGMDDDFGMEGDGTFHSVVIPFRVLFTLGEDFKKVLVNSKLEVLLTRARSDDNAIIQSSEETYSLNISKVQFRLPFVQVDDVARLNFLKIIEKDEALPLVFRSWDLYQYPELPKSTSHTWTIKTSTQLEKPRYVIVFFQTDRSHNKLKDASLYDHCNLRDVKLKLNNESYPYENLNQDFSKNDYSLFYHAYCEFSRVYSGDLSPFLNLKTYKSHSPLFIIDCSRQKEKLPFGPVDVRLEFESTDPFPAKTTANCIIIHDTAFEYSPLRGLVKKYES